MTIRRLVPNDERFQEGPGPVIKDHAFGTLVRYDDYCATVTALIKIAIGAYLEGLKAEENARILASMSGTPPPKNTDELWNGSQTKYRLHEIGKP